MRRQQECDNTNVRHSASIDSDPVGRLLFGVSVDAATAAAAAFVLRLVKCKLASVGDSLEDARSATSLLRRA